ncbi:MAG: PHP domain-containing protein, partial [Clostridia bacterium]|nr:PHP domain-containing protein [Clostridia bacterium]
MVIPEEVINEIKSEISIVDIVSEYVNLKKRGNNYVGLCPFHSEYTPSFTVYPDSQSFYCFGCGIGGDVIKFISLIKSIDFIDSVKYLAELLGVELQGTPDSVSEMARIELNAHSVYDKMDSIISIKELVDFAKENGMPAIALTDLNCVQGFPEFERVCKKAGIKPIYGAQVIHGDYKGDYPCFTTVLVKNQTGLKNLYHIISELKDDGVCENVPISVMEKYREGLLYGAHDFGSYINNEKMLKFYDYFEINRTYSSEIKKEENLRIIKYAKGKGKPVVAVSCAKFIDMDGKLSWRILKNGRGFKRYGNETAYLFNTEDMLEMFSYLGEDTTNFVINNTNKIAEQIEDVEIIPRDFHHNLFEDSYNAIKM